MKWLPNISFMSGKSRFYELGDFTIQRIRRLKMNYTVEEKEFYAGG